VTATPSPTVTPTPSSDCYEPPATPPSGPGGSLVQDQIADVAARILALVELHQYPGFTSVIADPDRQGLFLCWLRGDPLPAEVAAIVADPGQPITVSRLDTTYSLSLLNARVDSILGHDLLALQIGGVIHEVTVPEEGDGLVAGVRPDDPAVDPGQFIAQATPILSAAAGVPVTVRIKERAKFLAGTRHNDDSPWSGGARLINYQFNPPGICSSGFGVTSGGKDHLLTAAHCFGHGIAEDAYNGAAPPNHKKIGHLEFVGDRKEGLDVEQLRVTNGTAGSKIYFGGVGNNETLLPVAGVKPNVVNLFVATSGATSGTRMPLRIVDTQVNWEREVGGRFKIKVKMGPHVKAMSIRPPLARGMAAARGDSGGPVVMVDKDSKIHAVGTISWGDGFYPCQIGAEQTECAEDVFYPDIAESLKALGATLK
jgi:hypothetical protein